MTDPALTCAPPAAWEEWLAQGGVWIKKRARRIEKVVAMLAAGTTLYP